LVSHGGGSHSDPDLDAYANRDGYGNTDSHADGYQYRQPHADSGYAFAHLDTDSHADWDDYRDPNGHANAFA